MKSKPPRRRPTTTTKPTSSDHRTILARRLDMLADVELQHGHHLAAERFALRAAEMRGVRA